MIKYYSLGTFAKKICKSRSTVGRWYHEGRIAPVVLIDGDNTDRDRPGFSDESVEGILLELKTRKKPLIKKLECKIKE